MVLTGLTVDFSFDDNRPGPFQNYSVAVYMTTLKTGQNYYRGFDTGFHPVIIHPSQHQSYLIPTAFCLRTEPGLFQILS